MTSLLFGVVLYSALTGVLFAQLTVSEVKFPFTSLQDIALLTTHSLCIRSESCVHNYFTVSNSEIFHNPFRYIIICGSVNELYYMAIDDKVKQSIISLKLITHYLLLHSFLFQGY